MNFRTKIALSLVVWAVFALPHEGQAIETLGDRLSGDEAETHEPLRRLANFIENETGKHVTSAPLPKVAAILADPLSLPLEVPPNRTEQPSASAPDSLDALLEELTAVETRLNAALPGQHETPLGVLERLLPGLLARISSGSDLEETPHGQALAQLARAINPEVLESLSDTLASWASPGFVQRFSRSWHGRQATPSPDSRVEGSVLLWRETPAGLVVIGGPDNNNYFGDFRLIIDVAGNDSYHLAPKPATRVLIDLEGNDRYAGRQMAGAVFGAVLLHDLGGDDHYYGDQISLGAAVAGVAVLVDEAGDDRYTGSELTQGAALAGVGLLVDRAGHDHYRADRLAQGFGGARGYGKLIDDNGNDNYIAGFAYASSYGVPGNFQAFSQGAALGYRHDIAGGTGLLLDRAGDDRYRAGNYSQGAGYYFGLGRLIDLNGNDRYLGGRYSQGAAAHLGVGLLHDHAGDDFYQGQPAATQAGAWDLSLAVLLDDGGRDAYQTSEFGQAAAAQNAIAILIDQMGPDCFRANRDARGYSGPNDYRTQDRTQSQGQNQNPIQPSTTSDSEAEDPPKAFEDLGNLALWRATSDCAASP